MQGERERMTTEQPRRLADLRTDRAWSGRYLADRARVAPSTVVRIEAGLPARMGSFLRIAEALGVEPLAIREYANLREQENETTVQD